jgi:hypothetical protein
MNQATILGRLRSRWRRVLNHDRWMAELAVCPPNELHEIGQDLGLSERDLRFLACSHPCPRELMPKRLQGLGLDPAFFRYAQTAIYRDMERVCSTCRVWRRCARDLEKGDIQAGMRGYCLNAPTIDALTVGRLERART